MGYEQMTKVWSVSLQEQNGTERKALYIIPFPDGRPILAVDLGSVPHFARMVDVVLAALRPELEKVGTCLRKDTAVLHCPVDVRDAQKNGEVAYDLYAAIRLGERAAIEEVVALERVKADNARRQKAAQPTWEDVLGWLEKTEFAIDYLQSADHSLDSFTLSSIWRQVYAVRRQALKVRRVH